LCTVVIAGRHAEVEKILGAMDAAAQAGLGPVKVNMDVGNRNGWERSHTVSSAELRERIGRHRRGHPQDYLARVARTARSIL